MSTKVETSVNVLANLDVQTLNDPKTKIRMRIKAIDKQSRIATIALGYKGARQRKFRNIELKAKVTPYLWNWFSTRRIYVDRSTGEVIGKLSGYQKFLISTETDLSTKLKELTFVSENGSTEYADCPFCIGINPEAHLEENRVLVTLTNMYLPKEVLKVDPMNPDSFDVSYNYGRKDENGKYYMVKRSNYRRVMVKQ